MRFSLIALTLALVFCSCTQPPEPTTKPYEIDLDDTSGSPVDMRFLLEAPAGQGGFITTNGQGQLVKPGGSRFRIWGVNLSFEGNLPAKENAARYADLLARFGVNCIRVHHCDRPWPRGLIDDSGGNTRALHPEALERFDFFVNELKQRGIYVNLNLNVSRPFVEGDGVKDADKIGFGKGLTYFDPVLIKLQKEYAQQLLTHKNPYTGSEYRNEPAVVIVEMVNENSLMESWARGRLIGEQTTPTRTTWTDIPPSYAEDLDRLYAQYLRKLGKKPAPRLKPAEFATADKERFHTEARFYMGLERDFFTMMRDYLKNELGVRQLLVGTSAHAGAFSPYPLLASTSVLDIVDGHTYWQHPSYERDPATGKTLSWTIRNTPMVNEPLKSTVQTLSRNAVLGKPYTVSEVNHPYPSEYASEGIPILAAYGALHDWDGIFLYSFSHAPPRNWDGRLSFFDIRHDPVKMSQMAAGALLFLRGDVASAKTISKRSYTEEEVIESLRMSGNEAPIFDPAYAPVLPLIHAARISSFNAESPPQEAPVTNPIPSDTNELAWHLSGGGNGLVSVDAPRSQGLVGFVKENRIETLNLAAEVANGFCALTLHSLDGEPISESSKLLLATGSRVGMTGMVWNEERTTVTESGEPPATIETVVGRFVIRGLNGAAGATLHPLDGAGKPAGSKEMDCSGGECSVRIDAGEATPWYWIEVER